MSRSDELLDSYFGRLMPATDLIDSIKIKIDQQILKSDGDSVFCARISSVNIFDSPIYRRTAEIFRKAFSVTEKYKTIFEEE